MPTAPRAPIPAALLLGASLALLAGLAPQSDRRLDLDTVLQRAGRYVEQYQREFSRLVCDERFTQKVRQARPVWSGTRPPSWTVSSASRRLVSEFALIRVEHDDKWMWLGFRDVIEVDGRAVRAERNRLEALFSTSPADLLDRARAIADEGARHNLGQYRTINTPTLALEYLDRSFQARQWYEKTGEENVSSVRTWRVAFEENAIPTVIRTPEGDDVPARGIAWVEPDTGRVVRTRLEPQHLAVPAQKSAIIVTYARDPRLGIWVPVKMEESHTRGQVSVEGEATYSNCRRFEAIARIKDDNNP